MTIDRYDLLPSPTVIPKDLRETILRVGGRNPFDEPMYRLVLAECRVRIACGLWNIWPEGSKPESRGGTGIELVLELLAKGATEEMVRECLQGAERSGAPLAVRAGRGIHHEYNDMEGLILEKWKPASNFGPPGEWNRWTFMGEACLGPYPAQGLYELTAGPTPHMPTSADLERAIRQAERQLVEKRRSASQRVIERLAEVESQQKKAHAELTENIRHKWNEHARVLLSSSLGAGRYREQLAKRAGIKSHVGN